mmetsp:Transcript_11636/g.43113  ORF Transcript_11636/g.43113 Transcript_11636/m.43113 type:complete len:423 (-) Transcript_11636:701-1969(-)
MSHTLGRPNIALANGAKQSTRYPSQGRTLGKGSWPELLSAAKSSDAEVAPVLSSGTPVVKSSPLVPVVVPSAVSLGTRIGLNVFASNFGAFVGPSALAVFPHPAGTGRLFSNPSSNRGMPIADNAVATSSSVCTTAGLTSRSVTARNMPRHARSVTNAASRCDWSSFSSLSFARAASTNEPALDARSNTNANVPSDRISDGGSVVSVVSPIARRTNSRSVACSTPKDSFISASLVASSPAPSPSAIPRIFLLNLSSLASATDSAFGASPRHSTGSESPWNKHESLTNLASQTPPPAWNSCFSVVLLVVLLVLVFGVFVSPVLVLSIFVPRSSAIEARKRGRQIPEQALNPQTLPVANAFEAPSSAFLFPSFADPEISPSTASQSNALCPTFPNRACIVAQRMGCVMCAALPFSSATVEKASG